MSQQLEQKYTDETLHDPYWEDACRKLEENKEKFKQNKEKNAMLLDFILVSCDRILEKIMKSSISSEDKSKLIDFMESYYQNIEWFKEYIVDRIDLKTFLSNYRLIQPPQNEIISSLEFEILDEIIIEIRCVQAYIDTIRHFSSQGTSPITQDSFLEVLSYVITPITVIKGGYYSFENRMAQKLLINASELVNKK